MNQRKQNYTGRQTKKEGDQRVHASRTGKSDTEASFADKAEIFLAGHLDRIFWLSFALTAIFSILLFDIRFSLSGDDSSYVVRAFNFIHHFTFPGFQGPLYPLILSPVIAVSGISAVPLKTLSLLFILGFLYFFYQSFKNRIPAFLLSSLLLLTSINSFILYYGSQTYSEAFFMLVQSFTLGIFFTYFIDPEAPAGSLRIRIQRHMILGLCFLILGLTRSIGFSAAIAASVYFLLEKQWKNLLIFTVSFLLILLAWQALKFIVLGPSAIQFYNDIQSLASKDYYTPSLGNETMAGFLKRLLFNTNFYLSKSVPAILGFREADNNLDLYPVVAILFSLLLISACVIAFRKNDYLFFTGLYTVITLFIIFFISHTIWRQSRFIIPYFPLALLSILAFVYFLLSGRKWLKFRFIMPLIIVILIFSNLRATFAGIKEVRKIDSKFYGLTPDWDNYCRLSEWVSRNLPDDALVASRKSSISFIFSHGRTFFGITRLPFTSIDSLLNDRGKKDIHYYLIPVNSLKNKHVSEHLYHEFKRGISGFGLNLNNNYYNVRFELMNFPDSTREETLKELGDLGVKVTDRPDSLRSWLNEPYEGLSMIYPDSLLKTLFKAGVTHIMTDNIRYIPEQKNSRFITLTEKYMNFIEAKYPGIRTKIMQIGTDDNEPASLYRINYTQAGLPEPR